MADNVDDNLASRRQSSTRNIRSPNRSLLFPPAPLPQLIRPPLPTSISSSSYNPAQAEEARFIPRQMDPDQFFSPKNVLNLDPQPKPPVRLSIDYWNRDNTNNPNHSEIPNSGNINGNGNGPGHRLPWINPYISYPPDHSNNYNYPLFPRVQIIPPLFPFYPFPTLGHSLMYNFSRPRQHEHEPH